MTQGRQYELAALSAGEGTLMLDNPDGALLPPGSGSYAGLGSGTPVRLRTAWQGGSWQVSFRGDGATANPQVDTGNVFAVLAGTEYSAAAWIGSSAYWSGGITIGIHWKDSGGTLISTSPSPAVYGAAAAVAQVTDFAPATATQASVIIQAAGTPDASVVFYAAAV